MEDFRIRAEHLKPLSNTLLKSVEYSDMLKNTHSSWDVKMPPISVPKFINTQELAEQRNEKLITEIRTGNEKMIDQLELANTSLNQINQNLKHQLSSVHSSLNMILQSIGANSQKEQRELIEIHQSIAELKVLVECQDEAGIKAFIEKHGIGSVGLILQLISMFISA